ncbi:Rho-binding antiterminator [Rhodopirellula sp. JC639]|uniref:Rho-binding antiterminator n=1 Tax=Stieleria mannarensis TaxID=2755585 RepID=UPI0016043DA1|nr:Rho-binding antiterminator [Rhodopirellula sp. JC639]
MDKPYTPISCGFYDQLEILAMRKSSTMIRYRDAEEHEQQVTAVVVDVYSKDKQEWLKLDDGTIIRLDRLISVDGKPLSDQCEP